MRVLNLVSGGMDSATALGWSNKHHQVVGCLSFWYGSKHNDREWVSAQHVARYYNLDITRVSLDFVASHFQSDLLKNGGAIPEGHYADPSMKRTVVPFRNGIMLAIAAGYAESIGAEAVVLGNHKGDHAIYPDCRREFTEYMSRAMRYGTYGEIDLLTPFGEISKTAIVEEARDLSVPLQLTYSCYNGRENHCGVCGTCFERKEAFKDSGVPDPTVYEA